MPKSKDEILKLAKRRFKIVSDVESKQREREREDLRFQVPEYQWDEDARVQRRGGIIGGQAIPARPMLSISLISQPLQLIQNQAAQAHLGVEIHPVSEKAEKEVAEVKQGLYRRIERDSNAHLARLWALDRAEKAGRGWYRVNTQWDEDGDSEFDQEIVIERILEQEHVYMDPACQKADFSDARWAMQTAWVPVDVFKEEFPKAQVPYSDTEFKSWYQEEPEWVMEAKGEKAALVAEYWVKKFDREEIEVNGQKRERNSVRIMWYKLTGREVLEQQEWNGHFIPLIPVLGRELQPFDGERRWEGIIRQARDGQKLFNFAASNLVERMALEPKAPYIGAEGQFEGHEDEWGQANVRNFPYIEYKPTTHDGNLVPPPQRSQLDTTGVSLALQALQQGKDFVQTTTTVYGPSLGDMPEDRTAQSGRAILALQQQSDAGTGHYLESLAKISMAYEAKVVLDLMPYIYDRPGRIVQILGGEDKPKAVILGQQFIPGQNGGPPTPLQPQPGVQPPENMKMYDLNEGKYAVSVKVGKAYQTRLQQGQETLAAILEARPELFPMVGDIFFKFQDAPGSQELAKRMEKLREQQFPGLGDDDEQGMTLQQAQAELMKREQELQELGQAHEAAVKQIETDEVKSQARLMETQMKTQSTEGIAQLANQVKLLIAEMQTKTKVSEGEEQREHERESDEFEAAHEITMAAVSEKPPAGTGELEEQE